MTDDSTLQQPPVNINGIPDSPQESTTSFEEWVMRNKILISIIGFIAAKYFFEYMGWLHH